MYCLGHRSKHGLALHIRQHLLHTAYMYDISSSGSFRIFSIVISSIHSVSLT